MKLRERGEEAADGRRSLEGGIFKTGQPGVNGGTGEGTWGKIDGRSAEIGTTATELHRGGDK